MYRVRSDRSRNLFVQHVLWLALPVLLRTRRPLCLRLESMTCRSTIKCAIFPACPQIVNRDDEKIMKAKKRQKTHYVKSAGSLWIPEGGGGSTAWALLLIRNRGEVDTKSRAVVGSSHQIILLVQLLQVGTKLLAPATWINQVEWQLLEKVNRSVCWSNDITITRTLDQQHDLGSHLFLLPHLIYLYIRWFIRKAIQVKLFRTLDGSIAIPVCIAFLIKPRNKFYRPPDLCEGDNEALSSFITPQIAIKSI